MALTKVKAGNIILTTPSASSNDVTPATTQYVTTAIDNLVDTAPSTLNTLNELAAALGDDVNFSTTVTNSIAAKAPLASPAFNSGTTNVVASFTSTDGTGAIQLADNAGNVELSAVGNDFHIQNAGAAAKMVVLNSGNVGIGTNNPGAKLHVQTSHTQTDVTGANSNSTLNIANSGAGNGIYNAIKFAANQQDMYIMSFNNNQQADRRFGFFLGSVAGDATTDERLSILGNGNVGIGDTTPAAKLSITDENAGQPMLQVRNFSTSATGSFGNNHSVELRSATSTTTHGVLIQHYENNIGRRSLEVADSNGVFATFVQGKVGIGTDAPTMPLSVQAASNAYAISMHGRSDGYSELYGASNDGSTKYSFLQSHSAQTKLYTLVNTPLLFGTNSTERMRISNTGKVLIGDSASHTSDLLQIETPASGGGHGIQIRRNDSNTDQGIGHILFGNNTDTDLAKIAAGTDGNVDSGYLIFATQPTSGNLTDRMTIDSDGRVGIGVAPSRNAGHLVVNGIGSGANGGIAYYSSTHTSYRNICSNSTTAGSHRYWHVKTNIGRTTDAVMFVAKFHGYAYGSSGYTIDVRLSGYNYTANGGSVVGSQVANIAGGSFSASTYYASDSKLVLVLDYVGGYYTGVVMDFETPSPAGYNFDFKVLGTGMSANSTGLY